MEVKMKAPLNVLGGPIQLCSQDPLTGWYRDGCCNTDDDDRGNHTVCAQVTQDFLFFIRENGNDLITPNMEMGFPGLKDGDSWCVCAGSWLQAHESGVGCPVFLESTHAGALSVVPLETLLEHAVASEV
jgi:uncharacterized protein (DUF2237 family)